MIDGINMTHGIVHNVLRVDEVTPCFGGIVIRWSSKIGFGQYTIYRRPANGCPEALAWVAESETMDNMNDTSFGEKLLQLWMKQIIVVE